MTRTTRYAALTGIRQIEVLEMEMPPPGPGGVIVRVTHAGVCGTDTHRYQGDLGSAPTRLGHEGVGIIEEIGPGTETDGMGRPIAVGDRVYWAPGAPCHRCHTCAVDGNLAACERRQWPLSPGTPGPATFSQLAWLPAGTTFARISDETPSDAVIALGCAMPSAMQGIERLGTITPDDRVLVQGCGPVGIAATWLAARTGAHVVVIGGPEQRRAFAEKFGARASVALERTSADERRDAAIGLFGGRQPTVVIEAAGQLGAFSEALDMVAPGGRLLVLGLWADQGECSIAPHRINNKNLTIVGSQFAEPRHYFRSLELIEEAHDRLPLAAAVTERFSLERCADALDAAARGDVIKAVISPE